MPHFSTEELAPGTAWKAWRRRTSPLAAELFTIQTRLEASQWLREEQIRENQLRSLGELVAQAAEQVPFYRGVFEKIGLEPRVPLTERAWSSIPVLRRSEVRDLGDMLFARSYPKAFGALGMTASGGSTGIPVRVRKTELDGRMWTSIALREEVWHRESVNGVLANLRGAGRDAYTKQEHAPGTVAMNGGLLLPDWGAPTNMLWETGRMGVLQPDNPLFVQADFLDKLMPDYLLIRPAALAPAVGAYAPTADPTAQAESGLDGK